MLVTKPNKPKLFKPSNSAFGPGLPLNSLPGWENIPLNSKLPMLRCPQNQVIFTKTKIGKTLTYNCYRENQNSLIRPEFDMSIDFTKLEYNSLHDPHLKNFYSNERNLIRLRQNGEITQDNDVICSLRDFNQYRMLLYKVCSGYKNARISTHDSDDRDKKLIECAESITKHDYINLEARMHGYTEINTRKSVHIDVREKRFVNLWSDVLKRLKRIEKQRRLEKEAMEHQKLLKFLKMERIKEIRYDIFRKRLNKLKSHLKDKEIRLKLNISRRKAKLQKIADAKNEKSWELRLKQRFEQQEELKVRTLALAAKKAAFIKIHMDKCREKWTRDQVKMKLAAEKRNKKLMEKLFGMTKKKRKRKKKKKKKVQKVAEEKPPCQDQPNKVSQQIIDSNLALTLNLVLDMETKKAIPLSNDDPAYKAAEYVLREIINTFDKDLSDDKKAYKAVSDQIQKYIQEAKLIVSSRAIRLYASLRRNENRTEYRRCNGEEKTPERRSLASKCVGFEETLLTIGTSSYEPHPCQNIKRSSLRTPTPAGSLASIALGSDEDIKKRMNLSHLSRNEIIYIEHMLVKFMRELIVTMDNRVFNAVRVHLEGKIYDVRRDLINVDENFLVTEVTQGILKYAKEPEDYEGTIIFCADVLSSQIVFSLQSSILRIKRDPRCIVEPDCERHRDNLCLFCD
ncbi:calponin homology domain-containing protein DDB_G0272472-like [Teleopsis dalmanni]|uniref:calponin homology domain-containing protein DDB_G0272472-like n=1 Tax=Teleopsis dalmanni TaxID=139649 RepID=UPI0018CFE2BC|nr:calponin homology domain-containing protein DDB_G0272472-like [Teleopsis dalmanni]XP_037952042.1 calponin homology domain-containing protein DDB_G0272472-like [Teleopsis dalmanni]